MPTTLHEAAIVKSLVRYALARAVKTYLSRHAVITSIQSKLPDPRRVRDFQLYWNTTIVGQDPCAHLHVNIDTHVIVDVLSKFYGPDRGSPLVGLALTGTSDRCTRPVRYSIGVHNEESNGGTSTYTAETH